jgi:Tol biopolymer transport system component
MTMKPLFASILCVLVAGVSIAAAQGNPLWLRYPAISPDGKTIVFTYKGDLYRVPAGGGTAVPLTLHEAHNFMPVWSHDGTRIAFASDRYGNFDWIYDIKAGTHRRITTFAGEDRSPVFTDGDRAFYYLSEESGTFNVHKMSLQGGKSQ